MNQIPLKKSKWQKIQVWLVVGVIVGLPAISMMVNLYGSKIGRTFYDGIKNNLGQIGTFNRKGWNQDTISSTNLKGKVLVVAFTSSADENEMVNTFKPIIKTEQFREEVDNLQFLMFDLSNDSTFYSNLIQQMNPRDKELWHIAKGGEDIMAQMKVPNNYTVSLVDTAGVIRRLYDIRKPEDKRLLVEHISIMPIKNKKDVVKKDQKAL